MAFTFVHTADWQIGKSFGRFNSETAAVLRQARLEAIDRIATLARNEKAGHVLVAGDIVDSEMLPPDTLPRVLARLAGYRDINWHLLPGNHDPARPGGIWEAAPRLVAASKNIQLHLEPRPMDIAPGVVLLPAPLKAKALSTDPTAWMDHAGTGAGTLRIGLAHGSVQGFGSLGEAAVPIDPARVRSAGLAYLALGDWHGAKAIGPRTWYSGTPEADSYLDNGPGQALVVRLGDGNEVPNVTAHPTSRFHWLERQITLTDAADLNPLRAEIDSLGTKASEHLLSIVLDGRLALPDATIVDRGLSEFAPRVLDMRIDRRRLMIAASDDLEEITDPALKAVAGRLAQRTRTGSEDEQRIAMLALQRLAFLSAAKEARH